MNRKLFIILTGLMWIAIPLTALRYWQVWDALPASMATHFAADGHPNGWMPRETALYYALGVTAFMLIVFTGLAVVVLKQRAKLDSTSFALIGFFYVIVGFVFYVNNGILNHNLTGRPVEVSPVMLGLPLVLVLFMWIYLRAQRGQALPEGQTLAEETHGGVPGALRAIEQPAPVRDLLQDDPHRHAKSTGEMGDGGVRRDHQIERSH